MDFVVELGAAGGKLFIEQAAARKDKAALALVLLKKADRELFAHEAAGVDAAALFGKVRDRDKALKIVAVDHQAALDGAHALDGDDVVLRGLGLKLGPAAVKLASPAVDDQLRFFAVALAGDLDFDRVANFGSGLVVHKDVVGPLTLGQETFALVSNINKPAAVDLADDRALHDLAAAEIFLRGVILGKKRGHIAGLFFDSCLDCFRCFNLVLHFFTHY